MIPAARVQAAIDLLDDIILSARDGGAAADVLIARYFKTRRYAGSKDRRAVRDHVYDAIRRTAERPASGRAAMLGLVKDQADLAALFDGSTHAPDPVIEGEDSARASAVPLWIAPLLAPQIDQAEQAGLLERASLDLRINSLKGDISAIRQALPEVEPVPGLPQALRLPFGHPIEQSPFWIEGQVEVQDAGSQIIVLACAARPGQTVIDLCAGAGGKTLALAADMANRGRLIAADTIRDRLARLTPRAIRAGAAMIETLLLDQGREAAMLEHLTDAADLVLVDAPCSGTGTWRRNPEARWRLTPARLDRVTALQAHVLDLAAPLVKPGGRLAYAVCSLLECEGRAQADAFLARHAGWVPVMQAMDMGRPHGTGILLTPAHDATDGFFFTVFQKSC